ncbi:MAG: hypothetical protein CHACPFDD_03428 [Phycisphaerae bacterium]|nr:hypothetical protein [Phycisphaerae bacterium]
MLEIEVTPVAHRPKYDAVGPIRLPAAPPENSAGRAVSAELLPDRTATGGADEAPAERPAVADVGGGSTPARDARAWPSVYIVVPVFNRFVKTMRFLKRMQQVEYPNYKIVIVDDASTDGTPEAIELNWPDVILLHGDGNLWWSGGTNMGVRHALECGADYILTINDDCEMAPDFLRQQVEIALANPRSIVGCRLHSQKEPDRVWSLGTSLVFRNGTLFALNYAGQRWDDIRGGLADPHPVDTMPGNGVLIPAAVFREVGLYDDHNMPQYHADSDLVLRARAAGYQPVISLGSVLYNDILTKPLVDNRIDLLFSKKSDRYWRAVWATVQQHAPWGTRRWLFYRQYTPFFFNRGVGGWLKKRLRRLFERPEPPMPQRSELPHGFNPTCVGGPSAADPAADAAKPAGGALQASS